MLRFAVFACVLVGACLSVPLHTEIESNAGFSLSFAEIVRDYSRVSYCPLGDIQKWDCAVCSARPNFQTRHVIDDSKNPDKLQGYVGYSPNEDLIVVAFRGSSNMANWIANLKFDKIDSNFTDRGCNDCKIHRGFFEAYWDIQEEVSDNVNALLVEHPTAKVAVTGHSLGGAISLHAALDLAVNHNLAHKVTCLNFGAPRIGNENFAVFAASQIKDLIRVVHKADIVPRLPPNEGLLDFDFHHEPREIWNTDNALAYQECDGSGEDPNCSDSIPILKLSIPDHMTYLGKPASGCSDSVAEMSIAEKMEMLEVQEATIAYLMALQNKTIPRK